MYRSLLRSIIVLLAVSLLSGCDFLYSTKEKNDRTIKIAYPVEAAFASYEALLQEFYPDMKIEVVETKEAYEEENWVEALDKLYQREQPDLVYMSNGEEYDTYVENKWLTPLDDHDYPVSSLYPPVLDLLRLKDGSINGLARYFDTKLLFYNKSLFESMGIAYPTEGMSWEDLLSLANKFAMVDTNPRTYGIEDYDWDENPYNPFRLTEMIAQSKGMQYIDSEGTFKINDPAWVSLFGQVADAFRSGAIYLPENKELLYDGGELGNGIKLINNYLKDKKFLAGETAMAIHRSTLFGFLHDIESGSFEVKPFDWGVIPAPVDPSNPRQSSSIEVWDIFGIYKDSRDKELSWNALEALTSKDAASKASDLSAWDKRNGERLSVFPEYIRKDGVAVGASFANQELNVTSASLFDRIPQSFFDAFRAAANKELSNVIAGEQTPEKAIANLQNAGENLASGIQIK